MPSRILDWLSLYHLRNAIKNNACVFDRLARRLFQLFGLVLHIALAAHHIGGCSRYHANRCRGHHLAHCFVHARSPWFLKIFGSYSLRRIFAFNRDILFQKRFYFLHKAKTLIFCLNRHFAERQILLMTALKILLSI